MHVGISIVTFEQRRNNAPIMRSERLPQLLVRPPDAGDDGRGLISMHLAALVWKFHQREAVPKPLWTSAWIVLMEGVSPW